MLVLAVMAPPGGGARTALTPAAVRPAPVYGSQLQDAGIAGHAAEGHVELSYRPVPVRLADGQTVTLRKPRVRVGNLAYGPMARAVRLSPRIATAMIGLGLLEQIGATDIVTASDPFDQDGDGISGRPRWLTTANGGLRLGRFGWKAGAADLRTQAAAAFSLDIGLSTHLFTAGSGDCTAAQLACQRAPDGGEPATGEPEISDKILGLVTFYSRHLAVPLRRHATDPAVLAGKAIFHTSGCAACHRPHFVTQGQLGESALAGQPIWPYSDLLLHDMGPDLADGLAEGDASGQEWRTPPLWGLGLAQTVNPRAGFLHEGRARTVLEAILWHGGEATAARTAVTALSAPDREHLLAFLTSL
ncbi:MAG: di-heme oxidoredictase family protein [Pseudomonadota bacterium]|nr:di-heme oxidoredictase family protein [Pseudomonadota bacterium]